MALPSSLKDQQICILGCGYVGLTLAVAMADTGFRVHGIEIREDIVAALRQGEPHFWEPRLKEKLQRAIQKGRLTFSRDIDPAFPATVFVITVGTPLDAAGKVSLTSVERAARQVGAQMNDGALVILRSTVKLGTARNVVHPILSKSGKSFNLAVCPERTLEGKALIELHQLPQIIGADDADVRARCAQLFSALTHTTVALSSLEAAELTKLVDNTYRDVSFAFANEVARLCSQAGLSAQEVIQAGRLGYPRTNVALPGPVGGPCLEKDPHILFESAKAYGIELPITQAARHTNEMQPTESAAFIRERANSMPSFPTRPTITLAGLAFKGMPPTDDLRGTMAKPILASLREVFPDAIFRGFDPVASTEDAKAYLGIDTVNSIGEAFEGANIVVIANNHPMFQNMDIASSARMMAKPGIIYDFWSLHDDVEGSMPVEVDYMTLGSERMGKVS